MPTIASTRPSEAVGEQLARDAGADHLDAAIINAVAERARAPSAPPACWACSPPGCSAMRTRTSAGEPNCCSCTSPRPSAVERRADLGEVGRRRLRTDLDQRAAAEIDAEIQAVREVERRCARIDSTAEIGKLMRRKLDEVELGVVRHDPHRRKQAHEIANDRREQDDAENGGADGEPGHVASLFRSAAPADGAAAPTTTRSARVRVKAVKTVVMMPMPSVTAKPRTGPVPIENSTAAAMKVVMLESRIVASARLKPASIAEIGLRPCAHLLADALVDQHVGVDGDADGQHDAGDAGQRQRRRSAATAGRRSWRR